MTNLCTSNCDTDLESAFCLIWFFTFQSTIFQLCRDATSWVEPVLSKDKCVLLKDTTQWHMWGSNWNLHGWVISSTHHPTEMKIWLKVHENHPRGNEDMEWTRNFTAISYDSVIHLQFWAYGSWDSLFPISMSPTANLWVQNTQGSYRQDKTKFPDISLTFHWRHSKFPWHYCTHRRNLIFIKTYETYVYS